jgi:hypothetical protein
MITAMRAPVGVEGAGAGTGVDSCPKLGVVTGMVKSVIRMVPDTTESIPGIALISSVRSVAKVPLIELLRAALTGAAKSIVAVIAYVTITEPLDRVTCTFAAEILTASATVLSQVVVNLSLRSGTPWRPV